MSARQVRADRRAAAKVGGSPPPKTKTPKTTKRTSLPDNSSVGSDDFEYSASSSDSGFGAVPETPATSTVATAASTASSARKHARLPRHVEKQLLVDIQASGGIHLFDQGRQHELNNLLDKRTHLFGQRGDTLRKKIRNRVHYLKTLDKKRYQSLLDQYNISFGETSASASASVSDLEEEPSFASPSKNYHKKEVVSRSVKSIPSSVSVLKKKEVVPEATMTEEPRKCLLC